MNEVQDRIHASVVEAMAEVGLNLNEEFPKPVTNEVVEDADVIVTMGCGDACPVLPGKRYADWPVDDPSGRPLAEVRLIREDIRQRVLALLSEFGDKSWIGVAARPKIHRLVPAQDSLHSLLLFRRRAPVLTGTLLAQKPLVR
jgi:hypothetical protein